MKNSLHVYIVSILTLINVLIRSYAISFAPLSGDESIYAYDSIYIQNILANLFKINPMNSLLAILSFQRVRSHPPGFYLLQGIILSIGSTLNFPVEFNIRFLSLLSSLIIPILIIYIFIRLKNPVLGYFVAFFFILNPFFIFFSRDAHVYMLTLPFMIVIAYNFYLILKNEINDIELNENRSILKDKNILTCGIVLGLGLFISSTIIVLAILIFIITMIFRFFYKNISKKRLDKILGMVVVTSFIFGGFWYFFVIFTDFIFPVIGLNYYNWTGGFLQESKLNTMPNGIGLGEFLYNIFQVRIPQLIPTIFQFKADNGSLINLFIANQSNYNGRVLNAAFNPIISLGLFLLVNSYYIIIFAKKFEIKSSENLLWAIMLSIVDSYLIFESLWTFSLWSLYFIVPTFFFIILLSNIIINALRWIVNYALDLFTNRFPKLNNIKHHHTFSNLKMQVFLIIAILSIITLYNPYYTNLYPTIDGNPVVTNSFNPNSNITEKSNYYEWIVGTVYQKHIDVLLLLKNSSLNINTDQYFGPLYVKLAGFGTSLFYTIQNPSFTIRPLNVIYYPFLHPKYTSTYTNNLTLWIKDLSSRNITTMVVGVDYFMNSFSYQSNNGVFNLTAQIY